MPIRRRVVTEQTEKRGMLRHPLLAHGTLTLMAYNFVKAHPGSGRAEMDHFLSSGQPLTDLANEGLIRRISKGRPYKYVAVPENESGRARDKVLVQVTVFVNKFGEYSIAARMIGQKPTATEDFPREVARKEFDIPVPYPDEPFAERVITDINDRVDYGDGVFSDTVNTPSNDSALIIEGDYTKIPSS